MGLLGTYVNTFAEASHAIADPFIYAAGSPFQACEVVAIEGNRVTLRGVNGKELQRTIGTDKSGRQFVFISQKAPKWERYRSLKMRPFRKVTADALKESAT